MTVVSPRRLLLTDSVNGRVLVLRLPRWWRPELAPPLGLIGTDDGRKRPPEPLPSEIGSGHATQRGPRRTSPGSRKARPLRMCYRRARTRAPTWARGEPGRLQPGLEPAGDLSRVAPLGPRRCRRAEGGRSVDYDLLVIGAGTAGSFAARSRRGAGSPNGHRGTGRVRRHLSRHGLGSQRCWSAPSSSPGGHAGRPNGSQGNRRDEVSTGRRSSPGRTGSWRAGRTARTPRSSRRRSACSADRRGSWVDTSFKWETAGSRRSG